MFYVGIYRFYLLLRLVECWQNKKNYFKDSLFNGLNGFMKKIEMTF